MRARIAAAALIAVLSAATPARAGDPIMPLSQVRAGMHCTALSVVKGTEISSFNADVVDVIAGARPTDSRILVRVSGPAVDSTGVGPGFSGSPIYCPDDQGTQRNIGAISESTNEFGNKTVLATPIEEILAEPIAGRSGAAARRAAPGRRPLAAPLTVTGLSPALGRALVAAGRRVGRPVITIPTSRYAPFPPAPMQPGAAISASVSNGDLAVGAVGTVAYTDGDAVWAFGHPIDGAGRRSLLLQDAYVYTVINNPLGSDQLSTYKLATPGHDLGTFSNDGLDASVGRVGVFPTRIPVRIAATDGDSGRTINTYAQVADETDVDLPGGASALSLIAPLGVEQAATEALRSVPARLSQTMCALIRVRERKRSLRFCNRYIFGGSDAGSSSGLIKGAKGKKAQAVVDTGAGAPGPAEDLASALSLVDNATFARLHVTSVKVGTHLNRGLRQAFILGASARTRVRAGQRVRVTLTTRLVRSRLRTFRFWLKIPRSLRPGPAVVALVGTPSDSAGSATSVTDFLSTLLRGTDGGGQEGGDPGPQSVDELADEVAGIERYDGVLATFFADERPGRHKTLADVPVFRNPTIRVSGTGLLLFDVLRPRR